MRAGRRTDGHSWSGVHHVAWLDAWDAGSAYCRRAIAQAREDNDESLIGLIAAAADDGGAISDDEMMAPAEQQSVRPAS